MNKLSDDYINPRTGIRGHISSGAAKPYVYDEIVDASSSVKPRASGASATYNQTSIAGKSKAEIQQLWNAIGFQAWLRTAEPSQIAVAMETIEVPSPRYATTGMDSKPRISQSDRDMLENLVANFGGPAKPAKRRAPVARDSFSDDSTADLNKLYASLRGRTR